VNQAVLHNVILSFVDIEKYKEKKALHVCSITHFGEGGGTSLDLKAKQLCPYVFVVIYFTQFK